MSREIVGRCLGTSLLENSGDSTSRSITPAPSGNPTQPDRRRDPEEKWAGFLGYVGPAHNEIMGSLAGPVMRPAF